MPDNKELPGELLRPGELASEIDAMRPFTVQEYARLARITPNCVYTLVRKNELPHVKFGAAIRIPRAAGLKRLAGEAA
jgi:excisionase family DNA binding protein